MDAKVSCILSINVVWAKVFIHKWDRCGHFQSKCFCIRSPKHTDTAQMLSCNFVLLLQCLQQPFLRSLATYKLHRTTSLFNRRITCIEWHPNHTTSLAIGSKGGDIVLWDYNRVNKMSFIQGVRIISKYLYLCILDPIITVQLILPICCIAFVNLFAERSRGFHRWDQVLSDRPGKNLHCLWRRLTGCAELWGASNHHSVQNLTLWS